MRIVLKVVFFYLVFIALMPVVRAFSPSPDSCNTSASQPPANRFASPRAPRPTNNVSQQQSLHVSNDRIEQRDAVFRRLDVNTLVVKKSLLLRILS